MSTFVFVPMSYYFYLFTYPTSLELVCMSLSITYFQQDGIGLDFQSQFFVNSIELLILPEK